VCRATFTQVDQLNMCLSFWRVWRQTRSVWNNEDQTSPLRTFSRHRWREIKHDTMMRILNTCSRAFSLVLFKRGVNYILNCVFLACVPNRHYTGWSIGISRNVRVFFSGRERLRCEATAKGSNRYNCYWDGYGSHRTKHVSLESSSVFLIHNLLVTSPKVNHTMNKNSREF